MLISKGNVALGFPGKRKDTLSHARQPTLSNYAKLTYIVVFVKYLQFHFNDMLVLFSFAHLCNLDALLMLCNVLVYNIPILTYIIILTFIFLDGYMYVYILCMCV